MGGARCAGSRPNLAELRYKPSEFPKLQVWEMQWEEDRAQSSPISNRTNP